MSKALVIPELKSYELYFDQHFKNVEGFQLLEKVVGDDIVYWRLYVDDKYSLLVTVVTVKAEIHLKISMAMFEIQEQQSNKAEVYSDLLRINEDTFLAGAKIGIQDNMVVFGLQFILIQNEFSQVKALFERLVKLAEKHISFVVKKYKFEPI